MGNIQATFKRFAEIAEYRLETAPNLLQERRVEALLVDLSVFEGGTIADRLNLPFITICCLLPFYEDPTIPPIATTWQYSSAWWAKLRNQAAYGLFKRIAQPVWSVIARYRQKWQLPAYKHTNDVFSSLAIITRHIPEFEFPRRLPPHFHFTGSFHQSIARHPVDFPFEKLADRPLIYASMGTLQNRNPTVFRSIAAACSNLDVQLVISLGGGLEPEQLLNLPGNPIVVSYAPQLELLQIASLTITHAGLNTALESLSYGVPMVAIPVTDDQPGVAARIAWTGTGELIKPAHLDAVQLRSIVDQVLSSTTYQRNAMRLQIAIAQTGGVQRAAEIVEQAVASNRPVLN